MRDDLDVDVDPKLGLASIPEVTAGIELVCQWCGGGFTSTRRTAVACSSLCRRKLRVFREHYWPRCPVCSGLVDPAARRSYCSERCRGTAKARRRRARARAQVSTGERLGAARSEVGGAHDALTPGGGERPALPLSEVRARARERARRRVRALNALDDICVLHAPVLTPSGEQCAQCAQPWPCATHAIAAGALKRSRAQ